MEVLNMLIVFFGLLAVTLAAPPAEHNSRSFRNALNQQGVQSILQSIEERLRNLDQIYAIRYSSRQELSSDQCVRKIEMLETKLTRIESLIEVQSEKILEHVSSKNFKDDITKDQIFRKIDSVYERMNHKLGYVEGKLDMDILKLQTKMEASLAKIERLDHSISVRQADMEAEISEGVEIIESIKTNVASIETKMINITKHTIENLNNKHADLINEKFTNITSNIIQLENNLNSSLHQCIQKDFLNDFSNKDTNVITKFKDYEEKIENYGSKVTNMYNELWKKTIQIENSIKNSELISNLTRKEIQDNMNNLLKQFGNGKYPSHENQNDGTLEIIIDSFTNTVQRKFVDLGRKLESNFQNVMLAQNLFMESCHRIQMDESQLENKIGLVLEKLLDSFTNKSDLTFKEIQNIEEILKSHDSHVYRSLIQNTNTILKLSDKTTEDRKKIEKHLSSIKQDIRNSLAKIQDMLGTENDSNNQKFDTIAGILQELQEEVNDLENRITEDNVSYNAKQILHDVLRQLTDSTNKDTFAQQLNASVSEAKKTLEMIENIHHILKDINMKLNLDYNLSLKLDNASVYNSNSEKTDERIDVVLKMLPESKTNSNLNNSQLSSRFNYSVVQDEENEDLKPQLDKNHLMFKSVTQSSTKDTKDVQFVNQFLDSLSTSTHPTILTTYTDKTDAKTDTLPIEVSKKSENDSNNPIVTIPSIDISHEDVTDINPINSHTDLVHQKLSEVTPSTSSNTDLVTEQESVSEEKINLLEESKYDSLAKPNLNVISTDLLVSKDDKSNETHLVLDTIIDGTRVTSNLQDSFEYIDIKKNANDDGYVEIVTDIPELYEDDYE